MDANHYPEAHELDKIKNWPITKGADLHPFMDYIHERWKYADCGYFKRGTKYYRLSTGGWSGNESLIGAMIENVMFWALFWESSKRGGHYMFEIRKGE